MRVTVDGTHRDVNTIRFKHVGHELTYQSVMDGRYMSDCPIYADMEIDFKDSMEINFLIAMLEHLRDECNKQSCFKEIRKEREQW